MNPKPEHVKPAIILFGNVSIPRAYCDECEVQSLIVHGHYNCCGRPVGHLVIKRYMRVSTPEYVRRGPKRKVKKIILNQQEDRCFYCGVLFGTEGFRHATPIRISHQWDHQLPFSLTQNNQAENFAAACHVCNGLKGSMVFQTLEEAQVWLALRRKDKGYDW